MGARRVRLAAWSLWSLTMLGCAGGLVATLVWVRPLSPGQLIEGAMAAVAFPLGNAMIGLILSLRRPSNPIGWLCATAGLAWSLAIPWQPLLVHVLGSGQPVAAARVAALFDVAWAPPVVLGVVLPLLLLPDGHLRSRRWRYAVGVVGTGAATFVVAGLLAPHELTAFPDLDNPFGLGGRAGDMAATLALAALVLYAAGFVAAVVGLVLRFRAASGVERQQLRWIVTAAVITVLLLLPRPGPSLPGADAVAMLCLPTAMGIAILRYRLWDLDHLISRSVAYVIITAVLAVPYLVVVPLAGMAVGGAGDLGVAAATLVALGTFRAVRRPVQDAVDRRFDRRRYDAAAAGTAFRSWSRGQVDVDALSAGLVAVVEDTMSPHRLMLWLARGATAGSAGPPPGSATPAQAGERGA